MPAEPNHEYRHTAERLQELERAVDGLKSKHDMLFGMHTDQHDFIMDEANKLEAKIAELEKGNKRLSGLVDELMQAMERLGVPRYPDDNVAKRGF